MEVSFTNYKSTSRAGTTVIAETFKEMTKLYVWRLKLIWMMMGEKTIFRQSLVAHET